ncbi:Lhr family helicase [Kytococcus sedentarius]|uniref:ATP dependent helicase, Lhr family n=1 Tax=Kytococcus sedentarius (strain ATCC 14392 / DSM 20547 / JCM 11482 / CCUG 33030 / NBRC 15357 / NCTC 11040 / CCM 314 / 541) TaxID=478801 RepID=C7NJ98_KYTSD|nr:DEAD/DEAH box helicase [Kytococcus sedentarius]ACV06785.1 ATP dependent helicase, Lhr family [Kytococcus sedentarius DSM 20547]STX14400.1 putative ATP-dependent helicase Lhr [Kytococcus sedentarius]
MSDDVLQRFSPPTRAWFEANFAAPTAAQAGAWDAISRGENTVVVAPTGSGKTLSAFLWSLDRFVPHGDQQRPEAPCSVIYVSPLKALAVDVERNLSAPLSGIGHAATRLGGEAPQVSVSLRSGDTPAAERRRFASGGADVLITTPESLYLLLTSRAREQLTGVTTVIVDEVHALAGTKRGAHLALSLERLDAMLERPAQRIGLSATVRPVDEVGRWLTGGRPVTIVQPPAEKAWELSVHADVPDMADLSTAPQVSPAQPDAGSVPGGAGAAASAGDSAPGAPGVPGTSDVESELSLPEHLTLADLSPEVAGADPRDRASIWPHVEHRIVEEIARHTSTLVFCNSRRSAERLTARLNEIWAERVALADTDAGSAAEADEGAGGGDTDRGSAGRVTASSPRSPAEMMAQAGASAGAPAVLARAHHGSVSKEHRAEIEDALKAGTLPAVVATSSLELGIDMGAVDLVVQVESPPSVASGLQRVGRAGHQVGAVSRGSFHALHRQDLLETAVVVEQMRSGGIEALRIPANPLDVLAQQVVAACAMDDWSVGELHTMVRRAAPWSDLSRAVLESVLEMLTGRYPSEDFADLRPRLVWDRVDDLLTARPGAQRLAILSGGTIPDRGLFGVFLAGGGGPGRRVGELDEEMVYESRVGDVFTLGTSSWRIEDITHDQVLVSPAPGQPGKLPFWHGDGLGRPAELGGHLGAFVRELATGDEATLRARLTDGGLDEWAVDNVLAHVAAQAEATTAVPDDRTVVVERFRDELGDWRVVIHSPWGSPVHAPWALVLAERLRQRFGVDVQALHADDGIVLRLPDLGGWDAWAVPDAVAPAGAPGGGAGGPVGAPGDGADAAASGTVALDARSLDVALGELVALDPEEVHDEVTALIGGSALFASRFRECAARALLLPRRRPDRRQALWQQRQRAASLLEVAAGHPEFPIVLEAVREVVQDVYDVPALTALMRRLAGREVRLSFVETPTASPFAQNLMFGYVAQFLYEGDSPLAERRAAALALDPTLLADLLGRSDGTQLRDLLDPQAVADTEAELQHTAVDRRARHAEDLADLLRVLGPLDDAELAARSVPEGDPAAWTAELEGARRIVRVPVGGRDCWAVVEDVARLRDALGVPVPPGIPQAAMVVSTDPLTDLLVRHARTHGPFRAEALAERYGLGRAVVVAALRELVRSGRVGEGALLPTALGGRDTDDGVGPDFCDADVLRRLRRRSLAALRAEVEPVDGDDFARFVLRWQGLEDPGRGVDAVARALEQLTGAVLPASAVESVVLPARVRDYAPGMLDELLATGEFLWVSHGLLAGDDLWVSFHPADQAEATLPLAQEDPDRASGLVRELLTTRGAMRWADLRTAHQGARADDADPVHLSTDTQWTDAVWDLVGQGRATCDTFAPVRARLAGGRTTQKTRPRARRARLSGRPASLQGLSGAAVRRDRPVSTPDVLAGRWSVLPERDDDPTVRAVAAAEVALDRHGVVTRGAVAAEEVAGGFSALYKVLAAAEDAGRVRRGYFVDGLGAAQFATAGAVDLLRGEQPRVQARLLSACDPAVVHGAALPWPETTGGGHRPSRKAGALVALVEGVPAVWWERGGRTALTFTLDPEALAQAAEVAARAVRERRIAGLSVETIDGEAALRTESPLVAALEAAGFGATPKGWRLRA